MPLDPNKIAEIIHEIPEIWSALDGSLAAPKSLYAEGRVARNTELVIVNHDNYFKVEIVNRDSEKKKMMPPVPELIFGNKFVSSVYFDAIRCFGGSFEQVKELAADFIRLGYSGHLRAMSRFEERMNGRNPECLYINIDHRSLVLDSVPYYGGTEKLFLEAADRLEKLNLKRIEKPIEA